VALLTPLADLTFSLERDLESRDLSMLEAVSLRDLLLARRLLAMLFLVFALRIVL
jgi:hypothetical protein